MKLPILTLIILLLSFHSKAQEQRCGFIHKPNLQQEQIIKQLISQKVQSNARTEEKTYIIPILFHIIHTNNPNDDVNKITSLQIDEQIKILNNDYNRLNADTVNTPIIFKDVAARMNIQFILANSDTNKILFAEKGIIRHKLFKSVVRSEIDFDQEIKKQTIQNPNQYLNVWIYEDGKVISSIDGKPFLGYAQFPDFSNLLGLKPINGLANSDGVAISARTLVSLGQVEPIMDRYGLGRTLTHELGHFLGILHTFDDSGKGSCEDNDFCEDTPHLKTATNGCVPKNTNKCEPLAMPQNFMDYTNDTCFNLFTKNQVERMKVVLEKCSRRKELTYSPAIAVRNENLADRISIFPNPANAILRIRTENLELKTLKILSVLGQEVYHKAILADTNIDISNLSQAIYILQIETEKGIVIKKLLIQ